MAYTRTDWVSGETPLSAGNLNNIEDGIEELDSNVDMLSTAIGKAPKILYEAVANVGSPFSFDLYSADGSDHGTYFVTVNRYGSSSLDGVYWMGFFTRLSRGGANLWRRTILSNDSSNTLTVTMSGRTLSITNGSSSSLYAYISIVRLC